MLFFYKRKNSQKNKQTYRITTRLGWNQGKITRQYEFANIC